MGDLGDAIETVSGHLWTTHVHDNDGRKDDHRVPFAGRIDWDAAIMETQKIGYDGVLMFEVADTGDSNRGAQARGESARAARAHVRGVLVAPKGTKTSWPPRTRRRFEPRRSRRTRRVGGRAPRSEAVAGRR